VIQKLNKIKSLGRFKTDQKKPNNVSWKCCFSQFSLFYYFHLHDIDQITISNGSKRRSDPWSMRGKSWTYSMSLARSSIFLGVSMLAASSNGSLMSLVLKTSYYHKKGFLNLRGDSIMGNAFKSRVEMEFFSMIGV